MPDYYVYLLVDHDPTGVLPDRVFYVGKGRGRRALDHLDEAMTAAATTTPDQQEAALATLDAALDDGLTDVDRTELHEKTRAILAVITAGRSVRVDRLRADLEESTALAIESSVIDVLGKQNLTNQIAGHDSQRMSLPVLRSLELASPVSFSREKAVVVPGGGIWGGGDSLSGLLNASAADRWENARHYWGVSSAAQECIRSLVEQDDPPILLSVATGSGPWRGIVLLVEAITDVHWEQHPSGREGWAFSRPGSDTAAVEAARAKFLGQRLSDFPVQPGVRYSPALRALIP